MAILHMHANCIQIKLKLCIHPFRLTGSYAFVIFMVASVFRHMKTGPLRGGVQCQAAWSNFLYINNFIWDYKPTLQEAQETYGGGVRNP